MKGFPEDYVEYLEEERKYIFKEDVRGIDKIVLDSILKELNEKVEKYYKVKDEAEKYLNSL